MFGNLSSINSRAFRTLDPLSLTIAENFGTPTLLMITSIFSAMYSPVCESLDRSESWNIYSFRVGVNMVKFHMDR